MQGVHAGVSVEWLNLLWVVFGGGVLYGLKRCRDAVLHNARAWKRMVRLILGDEVHGMVGLAETMTRLEPLIASLEERYISQNEQYTTISHTLADVKEDVSNLRSETAINTTSYGCLRETVEGQATALGSIVKELQHNGGSSVKDLARDAAQNSHRLIGLFKARDDLTAGQAHFHTDAHGSISWVSKTYLHWTGYIPEQVLDYGWFNAVYPEDRDAVRAEWDACIEDERDFSMDFRMWDRDREIFWTRTTAQRINGLKDSLIGWYGQVLRLSDDEVVRIFSKKHRGPN